MDQHYVLACRALYGVHHHNGQHTGPEHDQTPHWLGRDDQFGERDQTFSYCTKEERPCYLDLACIICTGIRLHHPVRSADLAGKSMDSTNKSSSVTIESYEAI